MNAEQEAIYSTYLSTRQHLDDNSTIIAASPAFVAKFDEIKTLIDDLTQKEQLSDLSVAGLSAGKKTAKLTACEKTADMAGIVYAFADATGNEELKAEVNYSLSALKKMKDSLLALRCRNIHDLAAANKTPLAEYGVTTAMLADLQTAIDDYTAAMPKPLTARSSNKTLTASKAQLFKQINKLFENQLDKMIVTFKAGHPEFVQTYFNLREVPGTPTTQTQLKGTVTGAADAAAIKDALVTIVELGKTAKTNSAGVYHFKPIILGKYTVKATKEGFQDFETDEVQVKLGEINHLDIKLEN
jgi:hypothetical protein